MFHAKNAIKTTNWKDGFGKVQNMAMGLMILYVKSADMKFIKKEINEN